MSPKVVCVLGVLWSCIPGTNANAISIFKVFGRSSSRVFYETLLGTITARSTLECAVHCGGTLRCGSYKFHTRNGTCHIAPFVRHNSSEEKMENLEFTVYMETYPIMCTEAPTVPNTQKDTEGYFIGAVTNYTCNHDSSPCHNKTTSVCQATGLWEDVTGLCGQFRWYNLKPNVKCPLPCGAKDKFTAILHGVPVKSSFKVNVFAELDILLHARFRSHFGANMLALNTCIGQRWKSEKQFVPIWSLGTKTTIAISYNEGEAAVRVGESFSKDYTVQSTKVQAEYIQIEGPDSILKMEINPWSDN